jgi:oxaloacetate decarboxylase beta subunit
MVVEVGIEASEIFPLLLFIGIGAMIDFGPLLANPKLIFFGAAASIWYFHLPHRWRLLLRS